jgi:hypothetical protein
MYTERGERTGIQLPISLLEIFILFGFWNLAFSDKLES